MTLNRLVIRIWDSATFMTWGALASKIFGLALLTPLILTHFSVEDIVVWYLFTTLIMLLMLFDIGFSPTFSRFIAYGNAGASPNELATLNSIKSKATQPNNETISIIVNVMKRMYSRLSVVVLFIGLTLGSYSINNSINNSTDPSEAWVAWIFIVITSSLLLYNNNYKALLHGVNKIALYQRWQALISLMAIATASAAILLGADLLELTVSYQFWFLAGIFINSRLAYRVERNQTKIRCNVANLRMMKLIWPPAWRSGLGMALSAGLVQLSGVIYAILGQASDVASYLLGLQMIRAIAVFSTAPFYSKIPSISMAYASHQFDYLLNIAKRGMRLSFIVYLSGFFLIGIYAEPILKLIGSNVEFPETVMWNLLGIAIFFERFGAMHIQLYSTSNKIIWHVANGVSGMLMIITTFSLYKLIDVYSFPVAILTGNLFFYSWYSARKSYSEFNESFISFEKFVGIPALIILILIMISMYYI